ncbi:hypothetical protein K474DRAFT_1714004 [Panus rudis PR-1116 ss-1]|nr:hypothetical protein K474DRAFT_1714004 [Panus rudis PR-1116 ss-1]
MSWKTGLGAPLLNVGAGHFCFDVYLVDSHPLIPPYIEPKHIYVVSIDPDFEHHRLFLAYVTALPAPGVDDSINKGDHVIGRLTTGEDSEVCQEEEEKGEEEIEETWENEQEAEEEAQEEDQEDEEDQEAEEQVEKAEEAAHQSLKNGNKIKSKTNTPKQQNKINVNQKKPFDTPVTRAVKKLGHPKLVTKPAISNPGPVSPAQIEEKEEQKEEEQEAPHHPPLIEQDLDCPVTFKEGAYGPPAEDYIGAYQME